ncbi:MULTISPECIES: outer membrane protein [Bradyrhizobium]|uniref:outer membrane protein n=1 Tax=Bradyrhizobium TaxID=374 RepID=UPI0003FF592B|nr:MULTISPECIES: outer membrane beta-barrel protein [Bradyrhizobium]UFW50817.1 outer membrane beta-barrel protein [Bradyrhizobium arachidis]
MTRLLRLTLTALAGLLAVSAANAANAADLPIKAPIFKAPAAIEAWGGFYVGAGLGFRASESSVNVNSATDTTAPLVLQNMFVAGDCFAGLPCVTGRSFNGTAFRISPYLGYNWQIGRTVLGLEGDVAYADQTTRIFGAAYPATPFDGGASTSNSFALKTTWDASIRGRAGYLVDPAVLLYGTAGPSWIHVETTSNCSTLLSADGACVPGLGLAPATITNSRTQLGYTVGAGIEAMLWPNWIARAEYRFADYGHFSNTDIRTAAAGVQTVSYDTSLKTHTATFGLAYKFGNAPGVTALAAYAAAPSAASWSGAYLGVGAGIRANQVSSSNDAATFTSTGFPPFNLLGGCGDCFLTDHFDTSSARLSPYVGYNWQFDPKWLLGVEGDFGWADRQSSVSGRYLPGGIVGGSGGLNDSFSIRTKWDASIRARVGYFVNPAFLAYLTGGAAWMSLEQTSNCDTALKPLFTAPGFVASEVGACTAGLLSPAIIKQSTIRTGFTVGGGGEMKLTENWILRGEYRYADFGTARFSQTRDCNGSATINDPVFGIQTVNCFGTQNTTNSVRSQSHMATFGIAYRFN